jgi:hypothetical protein
MDGVLAPSVSNISVPHLSGIFVALDDTTASRSSWQDDLQAMKDVGIEFFIVRSAAVGVEFNATNASCPLGTFDSYYPARAAHLSRCMRRQRGNADALRTVLTAAKGLGLGVHLGLAYPDGAANSYARTANATMWLKEYAWFNWEVAQDLWAQYGAAFNGTIRGFYTGLEVANSVFWSEHTEALAGHFLQPQAREIHAQLDPSLLVWSSPYFVGNLTRHAARSITDARSYAAWWGQLFSRAPDFGLIAPQDSMGAQGNSFQNVSDYLDAMAAESRLQRRAVWSNVELFEVWPRSCEWPAQCHGRHPAPFERIRRQLANEAPRADLLVAWEWHSCLSPHGSTNASAELYMEYKSYVLGTSEDDDKR